MDLLALMEKEAKTIDVSEKLFGRNLTLKGYDDARKTAFDYMKDTSGINDTLTMYKNDWIRMYNI